jgi:hypothetical protein
VFRLLIISAALALSLAAVPSVKAGPLRNGARAVKNVAGKVLRRAVRPFRRGC